jgi:hypothetical protein
VKKHYAKLFLVVGVCLAAVVFADTTTETEYLAILLGGKKIGHAEHNRTIENGIVTTREFLSMTLGRGGQAMIIQTTETHIETLDGKPLGFEMLMNMSGNEQKRTGKIVDGKVSVVVEGLGDRQEMSADWPAGALLNQGLRLLQEQKGLAEGLTYEASIFRPDMMTAVIAQVAVGKSASVDLFGRVVNLTEVKVTMQIPGQPITVTSYINPELKALKTLVPMMNMTLEMVECDKAFALRDDDIVDFLDRLSIKSPSELTDIAAKASIRYELSPICEGELSIPNTSNQSVKKENGRLIVTVEPFVPKADTPLPYAGDKPEALAALKPSEYLQSEDEKIKELAGTVVGSTSETLKAARQIESFVNGYITTKDLSVGYASAAEVARSRQGDCSEHAVLTAAMCRAVGIPARVVCGVVYVDTFIGQKRVFGGAHVDGSFLLETVGSVWTPPAPPMALDRATSHWPSATEIPRTFSALSTQSAALKSKRSRPMQKPQIENSPPARRNFGSF